MDCSFKKVEFCQCFVMKGALCYLLHRRKTRLDCQISNIHSYKTLTFIKYRNALRLQCHNHTGLTMKLVIFFFKQTVNSIQPQKVTLVCVNGPILT